MSSNGKYPQKITAQRWVSQDIEHMLIFGQSSYHMQSIKDDYKRTAIKKVLYSNHQDFTLAETTRLMEMIDSEDVENMEVVQAILESKFGVE